tara:strand:+ start:25322 stop:26392 length:1071 start_codon:yes stop_codon:yes gene_type:complete
MNEIILVTGGAGFIGSHTSLSLLEKGYKIKIIDSFINSSKKSIERIKLILDKKKLYYKDRIEVIEGDLNNIKCIDNIFSKARNENQSITGVIHFAGLKYINESIKNPILYWQNNITGTLNLLNTMNRYGCNLIVFSSTAAIYGSLNNCPISENSPKLPINPYAETKLTIEKFLNNLFESSPDRWKVANLRYFNPIGSHESGIIGEDPCNYPSNIFPLIIKAAAKQIDKITIFGNDWKTRDGTCIRDYIHVMDLAEGHIKVLEYLLDQKKGKYINLNIGRGKGTTVLELINTFIESNKVNIKYVFSKRRQGDICTSIADTKLFTSLLNWTPKRDIKKMCIDGWKWKLLNPNGYKNNL